MKSVTPLLDGLAEPCALKSLRREDLPLLAEEIRGEIIRVVSRNGGHLASSLGTVELIIALHYVLDTPRDKIIFDVGHQSYAHKILTGRRAEFETLRQEGGLSGFPKRAESFYDDFDTGHSSTSVSAALGLACARDLAGDDHVVAAVLGDGALTGGMALEAMNHAGALKKKFLVILNDNNMSISPNVGGLSEYLSLLVTRPAYVNFRKKIKGGLNQYLPSSGQGIVDGLKRIEDAVKSILTEPSTMFETLGFKYLGPFDGHDVSLLIEALDGAQKLERPVLMHIMTKKGKGYAPAENDPLTFHGVGAKSPAQTPLTPDELPGEKSEPPAEFSSAPTKKALSFSDAFGQSLTQKAEKDKRITAISAAMSQGTGLAGFFEKFPERSFDVGIAEQHAVTMAAGLALGGFRPVAAIYSSFLQRAFDQLHHDVALQNLPVILAVDRAGLVGEDGPTHHGGLDLSFLRLLPGFTVMAPADAEELDSMLDLALTLDGPSAIRYPRGSTPLRPLTPPELKPVAGRGVRLREGSDLSILTLGSPLEAVLEAAGLLAADGISASVVNLRFIKPFDQELVLNEAAGTSHILTVEENSILGGLYGTVSETLAAGLPGKSYRLRGIGMPDAQVAQATQASQRASLGLDAQGIFKAAKDLLA
ncbi:1-deoxy-D-xylulose-5-phosphate synthase [Deltaproteobacteria bacterium Smac51]|nr:1-deoxy-D-xylulose-5-phosphate synthase [Deltaproteobacteria bacterium Smac51]